MSTPNHKWRSGYTTPLPPIVRSARKAPADSTFGDDDVTARKRLNELVTEYLKAGGLITRCHRGQSGERILV